MNKKEKSPKLDDSKNKYTEEEEILDTILIPWDEEDMKIIPYDPREWLHDLGKLMDQDDEDRLDNNGWSDELKKAFKALENEYIKKDKEIHSKYSINNNIQKSLDYEIIIAKNKKYLNEWFREELDKLIEEYGD